MKKFCHNIPEGRVTIKKLSATDKDEFLQLIRLFASEVNISAKYRGNFLANRRNHALTAMVNNTVVGGLTAYEIEMYKKEISEMFLFEIEVREDFRKQGVGRLLIEKLKDICKQSNIRQIFVITSRDNQPALRLYESTNGTADAESVLFNYFL